MTSKALWVMRSGDTIPVSKMTTKHLENAVAFVERKYNHLVQSARTLSYPGHQSVVLREGHHVGQIFPVYEALLDELRRRRDS